MTRRLTRTSGATNESTNESDTAEGQSTRGKSGLTPVKVRWPRRVAVTIGSLTALGLLLVGIAVGRLVFPPPSTGPLGVVKPSATEATRGTAQVMPDLKGLPIGIAREVLVGVGISFANLTTTAAPYAGPEGRVVTQTPDPGSELAGESPAISLMTSQPTAIADYKGKSMADVRVELEKLGAFARLEQVVTAAGPPGTVLETVPAVGQPMPAEVLLKVASAGEAVALASLAEVSANGCRDIDGPTVNGSRLGASVRCSPRASASSPTHIEYAVGRHGTYLEFVLGSEDSGPKGKATVRVIGDDKTLGEFPVTFGVATPTRVDVTSVLRLRIEISTSDAEAPVVVLGDARVTGSPEEINQLQTS